MNDTICEPTVDSNVRMEEQVIVEQDKQQENSNASDSPNQEEPSIRRTSALQDNIAKKGRNAYYFAHANKPNGPEWDGKAEPRLLSKTSIVSYDETSEGHNRSLRTSSSSFDYQKSNITSYSFLDDGPVVKLYLTGLDEIDRLCTDDDIVLDYTERSFCLTINNYKSPSEPQILCFSRLCGPISEASYKLKKNKIIITLTKHENEIKDWHTINDKGSPIHELV